MTYFEERKSIKNTSVKAILSHYPTITMVIPCWNEEDTVEQTVNSLLEVNYPKDKLKIIVVDDGSKDKTWKIVQKFSNNPQVVAIHKENGGKYSALNIGIKNAHTDLIGCLDADSYIEKDCLLVMADAFNEDKNLMAISPVQIIPDSKIVIQKMQKIEFYFSAFLRRMYSSLDATVTTPGPGTVFRKEVFEKLGGYKRAHNTEDCEITLRMQSHHMKIRNLHNAHVYTAGMPTVHKLYKQRLRWSYGTMRNILDYKFMLFNKEYGVFGLIVLPFYFFIVYVVLYNFSYLIFNLLKSILIYITRISIVGFPFVMPKFDLFFFNFGFRGILVMISLIIFLFIMWTGIRISKSRVSILILFCFLYGFLSTIWLSRSVYNLIFKRESSWR